VGKVKRKRRSPEEICAEREARRARLDELHAHIERIKAELAAKRKPSS
jgi:hypothetical protein